MSRNTVGLEPPALMSIPGGTLMMGACATSRGFPVQVDSFRTSTHLVTVSEYVEFLNAAKVRNLADGVYLYINTWHELSGIRESRSGRFYAQPGCARLPVRLVNWYGADAYSKWIGGRLPTDAEWEWAARGGLEDCTYPWGNAEPCPRFANYGEYVGAPTEAGSYPPNGYGLYDIAGNVAEWCSDWYAEIIPSSKPLTNPTGPAEGLDKVVRGGGYSGGTVALRCATRHRAWPRIGGTNKGFRVAFHE